MYAIRAFPDNICNSRVDAFVYSQVMTGALESRGRKFSLELVRVTKKLFMEVSERNIHLSLNFIESRVDEADAPSRRLSCSDARLSRESFGNVESGFSAELGHSSDPMAQNYLRISRLLGIHLSLGLLFRTTTRANMVGSQYLAPSAAQARLKFYTSLVGDHISGKQLTMHSRRSSTAVSLALEGVSLHEIMDHVGWKNSKTALHYIRLRQVVNPAEAAAKLADLPLDTGETDRRVNRLEGFVPAFGNQTEGKLTFFLILARFKRGVARKPL